MKPATFFTVLLLTVAALIGAVYFGRSAEDIPVTEQQAAEEKPKDELPISETGPWPKATVPEKNYHFETMVLGETGSHEFVVKNEGEAPLKLRFERSTCKCTLADLKEGEIKEVPPGESTTISLEWTPKALDTSFRQYAEISTNDPNRKKIELEIHGTVEELVRIAPEGRWDAGTFGKDDVAKVKGMIGSAVVEDFKITDLQSSSPNVTAQSRLLTDAERGEAFKIGYEIEATVTKPEDQAAGTIDETLVIKTDLQDGREFTVHVLARLPSPIRLVPIVRGYQWFDDVNAISFDRFPADKGASAEIRLLVTQMDGQPLQITNAEATPEFLTAELTPRDVDEQGNGSYSLTIAIPPGSPKLTRTAQDTGRVVLQTNHPSLPELKFRVAFKSY